MPSCTSSNTAQRSGATPSLSAASKNSVPSALETSPTSARVQIASKSSAAPQRSSVGPNSCGRLAVATASFTPARFSPRR